MLNFNQVVLEGNLTRDPEVKNIEKSGKKVANFSVANNYVFGTGENQKKEVDYFDVETWGPHADYAEKVLKKGSWVRIIGRLAQDRWEKDGQNFSRVKIIADQIDTLPKADKAE